MRLFQHDDFPSIVAAAAAARSLDEAFVEKDYYITEILRIISGRYQQAIKEDYERVSLKFFKKGYKCPSGLSFAGSAGVFPAAGVRAQIVADYPYLEREDVLAALEYAATAAQERELAVVAPAA